MKYYSDKLNKFFDTEDECVKAEADQKNAKNAYEVEKSNLKLKASQADENLVKAQENLEKAQDIIGKMNVNGFTMKAPTTTNDKLQAEIDKLKNTSVNGDMNFSLVVQGDVTKDSMPKLEKELKNMENRIYANIAKSLK